MVTFIIKSGVGLSQLRSLAKQVKQDESTLNPLVMMKTTQAVQKLESAFISNLRQNFLANSDLAQTSSLEAK